MDDNTRQLVEKLAQTVGTTTEHIYAVLTHQAIVQGIATLLLYAIGALFIACALRILHKNTHPVGAHNEPRWDPTGPETILSAVVLVAFGFVYIIGVATSFTDAISNIANPDYFAVKTLLRVLRGT